MEETISDFYITLPSDASMEIFPDNTQSSFRTKLSAPLVLSSDDWEVGLTEIFIPKTWYNVDTHNNAYSVTLDVEERVALDPVEHTLHIHLDPNMSISEFCRKVNDEIIKHLNNENVEFEVEKDRVKIEMALGYELHILNESAPKMLDVLSRPRQDLILSTRSSFKFKSPKGSRTREKFKIINYNIKSMREIILPVNLIKPRGGYSLTEEKLPEILNENIRVLNLENDIKFTYMLENREIQVEMEKGIQIQLDKSSAPTLMRKLKVGDKQRMIYFNKHVFQTDPTVEIKIGETVKILVPEFNNELKKIRKKIDLNLIPGMYKTSDAFFSAFQYISLTLQPNWKVLMHVPANQEINFSKGLSEMLGFVESEFTEGMHISKYPLQLDAGITEIYVYSDLISSHHVGDTFAPLLRVVPARSEEPDEIVKQYDRPLYFPLKNKFTETILIELRTGFGDQITFTSGKTHVVLSFRRKKL